MAKLGGTFDANSVEPNVPFVALPPGDYLMQIVASDFEPNSAGTGRFLKLELEVTDGDQAGRKVFDRLNLEHPNQQAVEIASRTLSAICRAVGVMSLADSDDLHFKKMKVKIATVPRKDRQGNVVPGEMSNEVKGYSPIAGDAPTSSAASSSSSSQRNGFTPGGTGASGNTPPWKKTA